DLCFLLTRDYGIKSSLQIVGNRYKLNKRQRSAIQRICASEQQIQQRKHTQINHAKVIDSTVEIDGFNLLILLESALSGAYIFKGRDGTIRDISSVHGTYKRVRQTERAIQLIGDTLKELQVKKVKWYLDRPISNSGMLKQRLLEISEINEYGWEVELVFNPDQELVKSEQVIISSDGWILDQVKQWFNLGGYIIEQRIKDAVLISV
ncbi:MAG: DUF434 domain-containing protein, partial [Bacteroidota bacterium]